MRGLTQAGYGDRWAAAVFDVPSLVGGLFQKDAIDSAANTARADVAPWRTTGVNALNQSADLLGLNGQDAATKAMGTYQTSPGYQFQMTQGLRAVDAGAASQGLLRSGATLKAEQTFGQGLADSDFGTYYSRLNALSTSGLTAAKDQAQTATSAGIADANIIGNITKQQAAGANTLFNSIYAGV